MGFSERRRPGHEADYTWSRCPHCGPERWLPEFDREGEPAAAIDGLL